MVKQSILPQLSPAQTSVANKASVKQLQKVLITSLLNVNPNFPAWSFVALSKPKKAEISKIDKSRFSPAILTWVMSSVQAVISFVTATSGPCGFLMKKTRSRWLLTNYSINYSTVRSLRRWPPQNNRLVVGGFAKIKSKLMSETPAEPHNPLTHYVPQLIA